MASKKGKDKAGFTRREFLKSTATATAAVTIGGVGFPSILRGAAPPEIMIGQIHPLSGFLAFDGQEMRNAVMYGIQQVNDAGGIKSLGGAKLRLLDADSEGKPDKAISEVERLVRGGAVALTGCYQSAVGIVATQVSEKLGVPFVIGVGSAEEITERGFKYTFRTQPASSAFSERTLRYLKELADSKGESLKTIAYLHESSQFGTMLANFVEEFAPQYGMKVIKRVSYSTKAADVSTEVGKIKSAHADVIFDSGYFGDGVRVLRTMRNLRVKAKAIVGVANGCFSHNKFVSELGDKTNLVMDCNFAADVKKPYTQKVFADFKSSFKSDMSPSMVYAYTPVPVIADAIERAGSADPEAIRKALAKTKFEKHILPQGAIEFDEKGQNFRGNPLLYQVIDGDISVVWPEKYAIKKPVFPAAV